jgi:hypothetical protein
VVEDTKNDNSGEGDEPAKAEFTAPSFMLKAKAPPTNQVLSEALEVADTAVAELAANYPQRAGEKVSELDRAFQALPVSGEARDSIEALFNIAHDIRGEGGSFGFPLASAIAENLCKVLEDKSQASGPLREAVHVHIGSLKLVLSEPIKGDGGERGAQLLDGLQMVSSAKGLGAS